MFLLLGFVIHLATADQVYMSQKDFVPVEDDLRICTTFKLDKNITYHIKRIQPDIGKNVHHFILGACERPGSTEKYWNCGDFGLAPLASVQPGLPKGHYCEGKGRVLFGWAYGTHTLTLPDNHAFQVGKDTPYKYLYLEYHYQTAANLSEGEPNNSGVYIKYDKKPKTNSVTSLTYIYEFRGGVLPVGQQSSKDLYQTIEFEMHPMFYQVHTHGIGTNVSVYVVKRNTSEDNLDVWIRLGKRNPTLPQDFLPVENDVLVEKGDGLAIRCTYFNNRTEDVHFGPTKDDEMCESAVIYWAKEERDINSASIWNTIEKSWKDIGLTNIPPDA